MARLVGSSVIADPSEVDPSAGEVADGRVRLSLEEAALLCERGRLSLDGLDLPGLLREAAARQPRFEARYPVYRSLRLRGYRVAPGPRDFRLHRRGSGSYAEAYVWAATDREPLPLAMLAEGLAEASNVHKRLLLGFVDGEGETTFFEVKRPHWPEGRLPDLPSLRGVSEGPSVLVDDPGAADALRRHHFGRAAEGRLRLSRLEAAYLAGRGLLQPPPDGAGPAPGRPSLFRKRPAHGRFEDRLAVYRDLRNRGLVVRTGFKFGAHFRIYKEWPAKHSDYLVHVVPAGHIFAPEEIARAVRLAHTVRKRMVWSYVEEEQVRYLEIARERL